MSNETTAMRVQDQYGSIVYNRSVFSAIARNVIDESKDAKVAETSKMFHADKLSWIEDGQLYVSIPVRISASANVSDVCSALQSKISESIEYMTDYKPESIQIQVVGFIF